MNKKMFFPGIALVLLFPVMLAAGSGNWPSHFFKGYSRSVKGGNFQYHSPQPDVHSSLLLRSVDSAQYIEWETENVPADFKEGTACFIFM